MYGDDLHYGGFQTNNFLEDVKDNYDLDKLLSKLAHPQSKQVSFIDVHSFV